MAKKTIVTLVDDLDGTPIEQDGESIVFAIDGKSYEIDLSPKNADAFRDVLKPYIGAARSVSARGGSSRTATRSTSSSRADLAATREWLRANGYEVGDRGRIPNELLEAYRAGKSK